MKYAALVVRLSLTMMLGVGSAHATETATYSYDVLGRLVSTRTATGQSSELTYNVEYDAVGNRRTAATALQEPCYLWLSDGEGRAGRSPIVFNIVRTGTCTQDAILNYSTENGTAIAGIDYQAKSGSFTVYPTDSTKPVVSITTYQGVDHVEFKLNISSANGVGQIIKSQGIGSITQD